MHLTPFLLATLLAGPADAQDACPATPVPVSSPWWDLSWIVQLLLGGDDTPEPTPTVTAEPTVTVTPDPVVPVEPPVVAPPRSFLDTLQAPVRSDGSKASWRNSNDSPYHCAGCGYGKLNDSDARDYSLSGGTTAGQPVYGLGDGGVLVSDTVVTYNGHTCANCTTQNHMLVVRWENPAWTEGGTEPRYYYGEYMHVQTPDLKVGDTVNDDTVVAHIQSEGVRTTDGAISMSPHLHFALFSSNNADVFTDRVPYGSATTGWVVSDLTPVDRGPLP